MRTPTPPAIPAPRPAPDQHPRCLVCDRNRTTGGLLVCPPCRHAAGRDLATIRDGYPRLDLSPGQQRADDGRTGGHASRPPLRIPVLTLDAPPTAVVRGAHIAAEHGPHQPPRDTPDITRTAPSATSPARPGHHDSAPDSPCSAPAHGARPGDPLLVTVGRLVDRAREDGVVPDARGRRTVLGECLVLSLHLDAVAGRWWCAAAFRDLAVAAADVRRALGEEVTTVPIGACPRPGPAGRLVAVDAAAAGGVRAGTCGSPVRARRDRASARCSSGHRWEGDAEVRALGVACGDAWLDGAALGEHLAAFRPGAGPVAAATLRKWAERDGWPRRRVGSRTLYRVADAVDSAWRRWDAAHPLAGPVVPPVWLAETTILPAVPAEHPRVLSAA